MYKIFITTRLLYSTMCSVATAVVEFDTHSEAETAKKIINKSSYSSAISLYELTDVEPERRVRI